MSKRSLVLALAIAASASAASVSARVAAPPELVSGGNYALGEQPDGNSVIIHAPQGAIMSSTGRAACALQASRWSSTSNATRRLLHRIQPARPRELRGSAVRSRLIGRGRRKF